MNNSQKKIIRDLHSNSRELHDSRREKAQFSLTQLYRIKSPTTREERRVTTAEAATLPPPPVEVMTVEVVEAVLVLMAST